MITTNWPRVLPKETPMTYVLCIQPAPECRDAAGAREFVCDATSAQQALQRWREARGPWGSVIDGAHVTTVRQR